MGTVFILFVYAIVYIGKILIEHLFLKDPPGKQRISGRCQKDQRRAECCQQAERSQHHQKQQTFVKMEQCHGTGLQHRLFDRVVESCRIGCVVDHPGQPTGTQHRKNDPGITRRCLLPLEVMGHKAVSQQNALRHCQSKKAQSCLSEAPAAGPEKFLADRSPVLN